MKITNTGVLVSFLAAHEASATFDWSSAKAFSNPSNTNNECSPEQQAGFNWSDLAIGAFNVYKGFDFSGFACSTTDNKRSLRTRTGSEGKIIEGKVSKNAEAAPKIAYPDKAFSITDMEISTSFDTDVEFVYEMPDGSSCKHTESCPVGGTNIKNTQCGGAVLVSFKIPEQGTDDDCDLGIHSVGFDCLPASTSTESAVASDTSLIEAETSSVVATSSEAEPTSPPSGPPTSESLPVPESAVLTDAETSSLEAPPIDTSPAGESSDVPPTIPAEAEVPLTTSTVFDTFTSTETACSSDVPDCPASSIKIVTMTTAVSTTVHPVTPEAITATEPSSTDTSIPDGETLQPAPESTTPAEGITQPAAETEITPEQPIPTSAPEAASPAASEASVDENSQPPPAGVITTEMVFTTVTTCPITITSTSGSETITATTSTVSQTVITSISTLCTQCTEAPPTTLTAAQPAASPAVPEAAEAATPTLPIPDSPEAGSPPAGLPQAESGTAPPPSDAPCPPVLPSCLNTWLSLLPECSSNSDASCFCPSKEFTDAIIGCVQAWGASTDEMSAALSYFTGICAADIPQNLAIVTDIPSTLTLGPIPSSVAAEVATATTPSSPNEAAISPADTTTPAAVPLLEMPVTVISYTQTIAPTLEAGQISEQPGVAAEAGINEPNVATVYITVPQVSFVTTSVVETPIAGEQPVDGALPSPVVTGVGLVPAAVTTASALSLGVGSVLLLPTEASDGTTPSSTSSGLALFTGAAFHVSANSMGAGAAVAAVVAAILV